MCQKRVPKEYIQTQNIKAITFNMTLRIYQPNQNTKKYTKKIPKNIPGIYQKIYQNIFKYIQIYTRYIIYIIYIYIYIYIYIQNTMRRPGGGNPARPRAAGPGRPVRLRAGPGCRRLVYIWIQFGIFFGIFLVYFLLYFWYIFGVLVWWKRTVAQACLTCRTSIFADLRSAIGKGDQSWDTICTLWYISIYFAFVSLTSSLIQPRLSISLVKQIDLLI